MAVLTKAQAGFLIAGMRYQIKCDLCSKPLGEDRREVMRGCFPICVHGKCRDLVMSHKLDRMEE